MQPAEVSQGNPKENSNLPPKEPTDKIQSASPAPLSRQVLDLAARLVFDTPRSVSEVLWRVFSILGLSSLLITGYTLWRYPDTLSDLAMGRAAQAMALRFTRNSELRRKVMIHVSSFISRSRPDHFALVGWPTSTTGQLLWDTGQAESWPVTLDGIYSPNLVPAVGPMVFGECWTGDFDDGGDWHLCPIKDHESVRGFVVAHWSTKPSESRLRSLKHLAEQIESMIY